MQKLSPLSFLQKKICSFGSTCSFEHNIEHLEDITKSTEALKEKITELEMMLKAKNLEIENLKIQIEVSLDDQNKDASEIEVAHIEIFNCEECNFKAKNGNGLKIHKGMIHQQECDKCDKT